MVTSAARGFSATPVQACRPTYIFAARLAFSVLGITLTNCQAWASSLILGSKNLS